LAKYLAAEAKKSINILKLKLVDILTELEIFEGVHLGVYYFNQFDALLVSAP